MKDIDAISARQKSDQTSIQTFSSLAESMEVYPPENMVSAGRHTRDPETRCFRMTGDSFRAPSSY
jgi:hypothetical protein